MPTLSTIPGKATFPGPTRPIVCIDQRKEFSLISVQYLQRERRTVFCREKPSNSNSCHILLKRYPQCLPVFKYEGLRVQSTRKEENKNTLYCCLNWFSITMIKCYDQKQGGEGLFHLRLPYHSPSLKKVRAGTWKQDLVEKPLRNASQ